MRLNLQPCFLLLLFLFPLSCDSGGGGESTPEKDLEGPVEDMEIDEGFEPPIDASVEDFQVVDQGPDGPPPCECPEPLICDESGACTHNEPCEGDSWCLDHWICEEEVCTEGCQSDADCAEDLGFPSCIDGRCGDCRGEDDCFGAMSCEMLLHRCEEPAECSSNRECRGDRVCNEGCEAPADCSAERGCPGDLSCGEAGECLPNANCSSAEGCNLGEVCIAGSCGLCNRDNQCSGEQHCALGECLEPERCGDDEDCIGARSCESGSCEAPGCVEDRLEPNDSFEEATELAERVYRDLLSCGPDFYTLQLPAATVAIVRVRQLDRDVDLRLTAYDAARNILSLSDSNQLSEAAVLGPYSAERDIYLEVSQVLESVGGYDLEIFFTQPGECIDDAREVGVGDDSVETGDQIRSDGELNFSYSPSARICPEDDDYYCFWMDRGEELQLNAEILVGNPDLKVEIYSEDGTQEEGVMGHWIRGGISEDLHFSGSRGIYCARVYSEAEGGTYRLNFLAVDQDAQEACEEGIPLDLSEGVSLNAELGESASNALNPFCAEAEGPETIYLLEFEQPRLLVAKVSGLPTGSLGDPVLSLRSNCAITNSEIACAADYVNQENPLVPLPNPTELRAAVEEPGSYALIVDGVEEVGDQPSYQLEVRSLPLPPAPPNDHCEEALALALEGGMTEVSVNLARANDSLRGCMGAGAPDVVYTLNLESPGILRAQVNADFAVGVYLLQACEDVSPAACGYGFEQEVAAGEYFLVLDGSGQNSRGTVTLRLDMEYFEGVFENETCANATPLAEEGSWMMGSTYLAQDDYSLPDRNSCTGYNSRSGDLVYSLDAPVGELVFVEAKPIGGWDLSLYALVGGCGDPENCEASSDGALSEMIALLVPEGGLSLVVDGSNQEHGEFEIRWGRASCLNDEGCESGHCLNFQCVDD